MSMSYDGYMVLLAGPTYRGVRTTGALSETLGTGVAHKGQKRKINTKTPIPRAAAKVRPNTADRVGITTRSTTVSCATGEVVVVLVVVVIVVLVVVVVVDVEDTAVVEVGEVIGVAVRLVDKVAVGYVVGVVFDVDV